MLFFLQKESLGGGVAVLEAVLISAIGIPRGGLPHTRGIPTAEIRKSLKNRYPTPRYSYCRNKRILENIDTQPLGIPTAEIGKSRENATQLLGIPTAEIGKSLKNRYPTP